MTLSITLKIAVDAPIPSASVSIAIDANPGVFPRFLEAYRLSCHSVPMRTSQFGRPRFHLSFNSATSSPVTRNGRSSDPLFPLFQLRTPSQLSSTPSTPKSRQPLLCSQISPDVARSIDFASHVFSSD